jgi:thioredoxin-like negative regulator of GroEL
MSSYGTGKSGSSGGNEASEQQRGTPDGSSLRSKLYTPELADLPRNPSSQTAVELNTEQIAIRKRKQNARWWVLLSISALGLVLLTVSAAYLLVRRNSRVDQLVILTVPSGAEVQLDSKSYGRSPIKLEQIQTGLYKLRITKENFEPIETTISITETRQYDYKLKPIAPIDSSGRSAEENVKRWQQDCEERFAQGRYAIPYDDSAHYYAGLILGVDEFNAFALDMVDRIHKVLLQNARTAAARGDVGQAQEIYAFLVEYYPRDEEARIAQVRFEAQLSARRGEVRDLVQKADEAFRAGALIEPGRASAYYYAKQAHAIDRFNERAKQILDDINERLSADSKQAAARNDYDVAVARLETIVRLFPDDKDARTRLRELEVERVNYAKASDPAELRVDGLKSYREEDYSAAIPNLEQAVVNGRSGPEVIFSLARSYQKVGNLDKAAYYYKQLKPSADEAYRSSIAALGEIAMLRGDIGEAVERYKEARKLGGSTLYSIAELDRRIEQIEKKEKEKEAEPQPFTVRVRHKHGGLLGGSCSGPLTVDSTGVRYDGSEHVFSSNLLHVAVRITSDEMVLQIQNSSQKFKISRADAERFREALAKYQRAYSSSQ